MPLYFSFDCKLNSNHMAVLYKILCFMIYALFVYFVFFSFIILLLLIDFFKMHMNHSVMQKKKINTKFFERHQSNSEFIFYLSLVFFLVVGVDAFARRWNCSENPL